MAGPLPRRPCLSREVSTQRRTDNYRLTVRVICVVSHKVVHKGMGSIASLNGVWEFNLSVFDNEFQSHVFKSLFCHDYFLANLTGA